MDSCNASFMNFQNFGESDTKRHGQILNNFFPDEIKNIRHIAVINILNS